MKTMRTWFWRKPSKFFIFIGIFILSRHLHVILLRILLFSIVPIRLPVAAHTGTTPPPVTALVKYCETTGVMCNEPEVIRNFGLISTKPLPSYFKIRDNTVIMMIPFQFECSSYVTPREVECNTV